VKIGIDCRLLSEANLTGIGRYKNEIVRCLAKDTSHITLYGPQHFTVDITQVRNATVKTSNFSARLPRMIWSQTLLPYWARQDNLDVFWSPTQRLPAFLPSSAARVVTIHDLVWKHEGKTMRPLSRFMESILMPQAIKNSDLIVVVSKSTAKDIRETYPKASNKIRVVYPGLTMLSGDEKKLNPLISSPYILFVGTLEPRKNLYRLMKAFSLLRAENKDISLVLAGGKGWGNVNIEKWRQELGLGKSVIHVGYVTDQQLSNLYSNALFLAMPSLYEGFGFPIIEAMSYGKAVVTSNTSSMPEVGGKAAVLVNPLDEHSIAAGLRDLLNDHKRKKIESEAKNNAYRFSWEKNAENLWGVFKEAVEIRKSKISKGVL